MNAFSSTTILLLLAALFGYTFAENQVTFGDSETSTLSGIRPNDWRPSFWTKTSNDLKTSPSLRLLPKPFGNFTKLHRRSGQAGVSQYDEKHSENVLNRIRFRHDSPETSTEILKGSVVKADNVKTKIRKGESFIELRKLADELINETVKFFNNSRSDQSRSYNGEDQQQHGMWEDKELTYHSEYDPPLYHHHYSTPSQLHYYSPQKKDDTLLTKVAVIALLKLILAKLKTLGFLKLIFLFLMKIPVLFFKFLFIMKGFKLIKLFTIPLVIASVAAPLLPLLPLLAPLLLGPLLLLPLLLPLLIPLLFFLPIIPVTTPSTAASSARKRREATFNYPGEVKWNTWNNNTDFLSPQKRPMSIRRYETVEESPGFIALAQNLVESQHCMERVACELANQNDSKIYQAAVVWALAKVQSFAPIAIKQKLERYSEAYKNGVKWKSSCHKFQCQRPRVLLIQGRSKYKVF